MKKLMIAVSAALCATVGFSDVTSANIVGYTTESIATSGQQKMIGANFIAVGGSALDIQDIAVGGNFGNGGVRIKWWDAENKVYSGWACYWKNGSLFDEGWNLLDHAGWGNEQSQEIQKTFNPGEGFWLYSSTDGATINISGQVYETTDDYIGVTIPTSGQQKMIINPFPTSLDIQTIAVAGNFGNGGVRVKWWDAENKVYSGWACYWKNGSLFDEGWNLLDHAGWGNEQSQEIQKTFNPGEGFWVYSSTDGAEIRIPSLKL